MEPYPRPDTRSAPRLHRNPIGFSWTLFAVLIIITGYSGMAAHRLKDDAATVATVTTSFWLFLALLLCFLSLKERAAAGSASRGQLKAFVWALSTLLFFHVAYMAMGAASLTLHVAMLVWFLPAPAWAGFFIYAFFNRRGRVNQSLEEIIISIV